MTEGVNAGLKERLSQLSKVFGSSVEDDLDIRFNPDILSSSVKHVDSEGVKCQQQKKQIVQLGDFLLTRQIPAFINELKHVKYDPTLSEGILIRLRNNYGINVRYMGYIAKKMQEVPELSYPYTVVVGWC